jgi:hypothetical protein
MLAQPSETVAWMRWQTPVFIHWWSRRQHCLSRIRAAGMSCYKRQKVFRKEGLGHRIGPSEHTAAILAAERRPCTSAIDPKLTFIFVAMLSI